MVDLDDIHGIKNGDKNAFRRFFDRYYNSLIAYITTFTNDKMESEDIVQQVFVSVWDGRAGLEDIKYPKKYIFTMAYYKYLDTVKNLKKRDKFFVDLYHRALEERVTEDKEIAEKRIEKLKQIIDSLPNNCKKIIIMNKVDGLKYKEIAETLNISVKTVESQMRIAFIKIRKSFEDDHLFLLFLTKKFLP